MYSENERIEIFNSIIEKFEKREDIISVIQIGSGAIGYRDKFSDLDIALVVNDSNINQVFEKTYNDINNLYSIEKTEQMDDRKLQLFLLDNYLEIDIGYYTLDTISARRKNYKVIFDKSNKVQEIMDNSWIQAEKENMGTTSKVDMKKIIELTNNDFWYSFLHSIIAFKRNNLYRCYYELQELKDICIDLVSKRNEIESKRYRDINKLPKLDMDKITKLFYYPNSYEELEIYLLLVLKIIENEFNYWRQKEKIMIIFNAEFYKKFIEENK